MSATGDIDTLISDHLEGLLGEDGRRRLEAWLAEAPAHRQRFLRLVMDHAALTRLAATMAAKPPTLRTRRILARRRPAPWLVPLALAAGLALAIGGWWWWPQAEPSSRLVAMARENQPQLTAVTGSADGTIGTRLAPGTALTTAADGAATLRWNDGSEVRLAADTRVEIVSGIGLRLLHGRISAEVAAQPAARSARFATGDAEVLVVGTSLAVATADGESAAEVSHGRVQVRRIADGAEVAVSAGECVAIAPGLPLRARPLGSPAGTVHQVAPGAAWPDQAALRPGDVIELAAGTHTGAWRWIASGTTLRPIVLRGAGPDSTTIDASDASTSGEHGGARAALQVEARQVEISGLALRGARNGTNAAGIRLLSGADGIVVRDCRIAGCELGIASDSGAGSLLVDDCVLTGNGVDDPVRAYGNLKLANSSTSVRGCRLDLARFGVNVELHDGRHRLIANRIAGGADGAIGLVLAGGGDSRLELLGNLVLGGQREQSRNRNRFLFVNRPPGVANSASLVVRSCTLVASDARNQIIDAPGCQVELSTSIVVGGAQLATAGTSLTGRGNCLPTGADDSGLSGTLRGDPGFLDAAHGDFRLAPASPCRGAAPTSTPPPALEPPAQDHRARERTSAVDLGAFQAP